ncbi:MAG: ABC transporter ATP-binding protein [Clostridiales bacterium]|nr:ABC transporter ATP-binding protein [Clostridiales bacterium]
MLKLVRFLKKYKWQTTFGPMFKLLEAILELIVPIVMARMIDQGIAVGDTNYILRQGLVMVGLGILGLGASLTAQWMASVASQGVGTDIRKSLFAHIQKFSYKELDHFGADTLTTRMTNDINQIQVVVAMLIRLVSRAPFLAIGAIYMAFRVNASVTWIFLLVVPLISLVLYLIMGKTIPLYKKVQNKLDVIGRISRENLTGARVVRAFGAQQREEENFHDECVHQAEMVMKINRITALLSPLIAVILNGAIGLLLWTSGQKIQIGEMTQGDTIALVNYLTQISLALVVVANLVVIFTKGAASAARINEVFEMHPSIMEDNNEENNLFFPQEAPYIEYENVSFGYYAQWKMAIENVSFTVEKGQRIGIIGGTGAGKSTLMQLLPRFYDVTGGEIRLQGKPIKAYPLLQLRGSIGIVAQNPTLFTGTVASNLRFGNEEATDQELWTALEIAQMKETVLQLPKKLESPVLKGGSNFSGGQRQRFTIARALVKKPQILILDDSASALDYATDAALRKELKSHCKETTQFIISQRVNAIEDCDLILVMDHGHIAGVGTHQQLLQANQLYQEIVASQPKESEEILP